MPFWDSGHEIPMIICPAIMNQAFTTDNILRLVPTKSNTALAIQAFLIPILDMIQLLGTPAANDDMRNAA